MSAKIRHIEVVPYNPKWPEMFEEEARSIRTPGPEVELGLYGRP